MAEDDVHNLMLTDTLERARDTQGDHTYMMNLLTIENF